jgi:hypothetical protein
VEAMARSAYTVPQTAGMSVALRQKAAGALRGSAMTWLSTVERAETTAAAQEGEIAS